MKAADAPAGPRPIDDPLLRLQLRGARRPNELARFSPCRGSARRARETWDQAVRELGLERAGARPRRRPRRLNEASPQRSARSLLTFP